MNIKISFFTLILLSISAWSFCAEKVVTISTLEDYAPFCFKLKAHKKHFPPGTDSEGFQGYSWDILRESFHEMGYTIRLSVTPWARAMMLLKNGKFDILFPTGKNTERQKIFYYSNEPVNQAKFLIYVRRDNPIKWDGLQSLKGLTIGVKRGFNYGDKWKAVTYLKKHNIKKILQGFRMLHKKRIDGFLGYECNWDYALNKTGWKAKFRKLPAFDSTKEYLVALKTNSHAKEILNAFDIGKRRLIQNGKFKKIEKKWLGKGYCQKPMF